MLTSALCALALACGGPHKEAEKPPTRMPEADPPAHDVPPAPEPVPDGLRVTAERTPEGTIQIRVQNRGTAVFSLRPVFELVDAEDKRVPGARVSARAACGEPLAARECVTLAPGAELLPVPFALRSGDTQCGEPGADLPGNTYEIALRGCGEHGFSRRSPLPRQSP